MKVKYGKCKCGCSEEETALYSKGYRKYCYWKITNENAKSRREQKREPTSKDKAKKKTYRIPKFSKNKLKELAVYRPLRDKFMADNPICQFKGCSKLANDLHHKSSRGKHLCNVDTFLAVCRLHHNYIHDNHAESVMLGYIEKIH